MDRREFLKKLGILGAGIALEKAIPSSLIPQESERYKTIWKDIEKDVEKLKSKFGLKDNEFAIIISPQEQKLYLIRGKDILKEYSISTSKNGLGTKIGSSKTPIGTHRIKEKIGKDAPLGTIFKNKTSTGKIAKIYHKEENIPKENFITSRIISLEGQEEGINKGGNVDSYERGIYIHGTNKENLIGKPASGGCIRMKNKDIIELFEIVPEQTLVEIQNKVYKKEKE
jgi:lipoprotein-anchoring transpeptidase ErfK/SrfK